MKIKSVEIENFRSVRSLHCEFTPITTFIGPNGAGKSTILRALDWVFNGEKNSLSAEDVYASAESPARVRVRVDFSDISDIDRRVLGPKYAAEGRSEFTLWRTWSPDEDKLTGRALAYPPFEEIRACLSATEKRAAYLNLRTDRSDLNLPPCSSAQAVEDAMEAWELANPSELRDAEVSDTNLFGFAGRGKIGEIFDFVFVSADLRAEEEAADSRDSILGRILQRAIQRRDLEREVAALISAFESEFGKLNDKHLASQLRSLSEELTDEVGSLTRGRSVQLTPNVPNVKPAYPKIDLTIASDSVSTPVARQGHGFQRSLLLGALTVLSRHAHKDNAIQMFLGIEEPELFQHPTQQRALASVLRRLAYTDSNRIQIAWATHSALFVSPKDFDEVRRITNT